MPRASCSYRRPLSSASFTVGPLLMATAHRCKARASCRRSGSRRASAKPPSAKASASPGSFRAREAVANTKWAFTWFAASPSSAKVSSARFAAARASCRFLLPRRPSGILRLSNIASAPQRSIMASPRRSPFSRKKASSSFARFSASTSMAFFSAPSLYRGCCACTRQQLTMTRSASAETSRSPRVRAALSASSAKRLAFWCSSEARRRSSAWAS
mmetsp:Transcript_46801/g.109286  ORF Transcript_46801/g.109286 Transcript_46801/m.109286 type:complete len:215 (-) Transcript_46801:49-693(-)